MATAKTEKLVRARVLVNCIPLGVLAGQVIEAPASVIKAHAGELDSEPAAVAYALKEGGKVVTYEPPAALEEEPPAEQSAGA